MTITLNHHRQEPTAMFYIRLVISRLLLALLYRLAVNSTCLHCGKHVVLPMEDEVFDLPTRTCFDCAEHRAFIDESYDANCEERSWGEDCDAQRDSYEKSHPFTIKCGAGCGRDILSNVQLPPTTLCYKCEQDIPF